MSRPDGAELKRVNSYQWPAGHVNHLSEGQQGALRNFKALCQQKGYFEPGDEKTPASHDDETLLRYLRARKFIPQDAFKQFKDTEDWRQQNQLDTLYETIDIEEYEATRRLYPQWTGRRDNRGIPFYVFEVGQVNYKDVVAYQDDSDRKKDKNSKVDAQSKVPRKMLRLFALYENLCRFVLPLCSAVPNRPSPETPVSQSSNIVDLSKVGIKTFWNLRAHLQDSSALATAHYPETLDHIFVVGAPSFFPTIWNWAKAWFDPITVQKISILSDKNMLSELQKYVHIDNIPKKYGGNLDWKFGDMPVLEPNLANAMRWKEDVRDGNGNRTLPIGPIKWQYDDDGDLVAIAIGSEKGSPRNQVLAGLHPEEGVTRLALSPGRQTTPHQALFATASRTGAQTPHQSTTKAPEHDATLPNANGSIHPTPTNNPSTMAAETPQSPSDPLLDTGKSVNASSPDTSRAGTYTVPYRDPVNEIQSPPEHANRQGTSCSKFAQQDLTHASGQLEQGTPHVRPDGQGNDVSVMEPRTVGQAPKETPLHREEEHTPTVVEQAQEYAAQAHAAVTSGVATVASAVVGGLSGTAEEKQEKVKAEDARIDQLEPHQVEEFMRAQSKSQPEKVQS
ncbi:hypothetical protein AC579_5610 [Pseudocercospora musae]|uniref:CRAL-TRIO domain-containing protein n=1 Tax=Pseudocercospora musae TaxID=113226 RepID=A0A139I148_9PEZI|nr:hypothetical protein AC579_5610 [Pseudocercospora musae]